MTEYSFMSSAELARLKQEHQLKYDQYKDENLSLDMSRGKPCSEQLDLSMGILDVLSSNSSTNTKDGVDVRNYGGIDGIAEAKAFFAEVLEVTTKEIIIGGNSSLTMMHDTIARAMLHGMVDSDQPWGKLPKVKFLCPSPGYDRHFAICELLGIEMILVDMTEEGPDMDTVEKLVREDASIKGMWCVPKYSNPQGYTYSDEVVERIANMTAKANDFRVFWDNAYTIHHLSDEPDQLKNILAACKAAGTPNRALIFSSTSKVTFPGAGVAMMAASEDNINQIKKMLAFQTIGPDKLNQLRHVRFFKTLDNLESLMKSHAAIIKPKFDMVLQILDEELGGKNIAWWTKPKGGYFISLDTLDGCAKEVVALAANAGVTLTTVGATFPYGKDPRDRNIRLAPTMPSLSELKKAIQIVCLCIKLVSIDKMLGQMN